MISGNMFLRNVYLIPIVMKSINRATSKKFYNNIITNVIVNINAHFPGRISLGKCTIPRPDAIVYFSTFDRLI